MNYENPIQSQESGPTITREEVITAFKKLISKGIKSIANMEESDEDVGVAALLFDKLRREQTRAAGDDKVAHLRNNLEWTMLQFDAGFDYLPDLEALETYLVCDEGDISANEDIDPEAKEKLLHDTNEALARVRAKIAEHKD